MWAAPALPGGPAPLAPPPPHADTPAPGRVSWSQAHQPPGGPPALQTPHAPFLAASQLPRWGGTHGCPLYLVGSPFPPRSFMGVPCCLLPISTTRWTLQKEGQARQNSDTPESELQGGPGRCAGPAATAIPAPQRRRPTGLSPPGPGAAHIGRCGHHLPASPGTLRSQGGGAGRCRTHRPASTTSGLCLRATWPPAGG